ncbi:MAG: DUF4388 domain-containing protein [Desulfomonile tiedjei]|nr:DUF4388 domain-containing protein [Desulfomonile tiedjei]
MSEVMDFSSYDLMTTIRLIVLSGESRRVDVKRGSRSGCIYIKAGEIYRVVADQRQGDAAFFEIISWDRAVHKDSQESTMPEGNMRISTHVLLQAMRNQVYQK